MSATTRKMTDSEKLDYLIEMLESVQQNQENMAETLEDHGERLQEIGSGFGEGFEYETA